MKGPTATSWPSRSMRRCLRRGGASASERWSTLHDGNSWPPQKDRETAVAAHVDDRVAQPLHADNVGNASRGLHLAGCLVQALELQRIASPIGVKHSHEVLGPAGCLTEEDCVLGEVGAGKLAQLDG